MNDLQKEDARRRQANKRARDAGKPEPYPKVDREAIAARRAQNEADLAWANELDASGIYYKSEARSAVDLLKIYEGVNLQDTDEDDETGDDAKKKYQSAKKEPRPNPSVTIIKIRSTEYEPDAPKEFRNLTEVNEVVSFRRWLDLRDKARKNLFWLGRLLNKDLYHSVHQVVCDQFVQKDFDGCYFPEYNLQDFHEALSKQQRLANDGVTPTREMILLDPRGCFKSTIDGIDCVSWLINCPDIRIMILTGEFKLAVSFMREVKSYFYLLKKGTPTAFQLLFPEYVLTGIEGRSKEPFLTPAGVLNKKGESLMVNSIEAGTSGWHCDILKADDVVNNKNSETPELREKLKFQFDGTDNILDKEWGFSDVIGTRYFTDDWYGTRMRPNEDGEVAPYKYHVRGAWVVKPEYRVLKLRELTEDMVTLTFPQKLSWKNLRSTLLKSGERGFRNQLLNEPTDAADDSGYQLSFSIDVLRAHSYPAASAPKNGRILQTWDWSYSDRKTSDYSVGVTAMLYQQDNGQYALCILEIVFGKWKASELVFQILAFHKKWNPERVLIENANGGELLKLAILQRAQLLGSDILQNTYWMPVSSQANAKKNRIKSLEILLADDRLHFVNGSWIDETFKQLTEYTGAKSTGSKKDDIPDGLSYLVEMMPRIALTHNADSTELEKQAEKEERESQRKASYHFHFGQDFTPPPPPVVEPEKPQDTRRSILSRIFGGNGMRA